MSFYDCFTEGGRNEPQTHKVSKAEDQGIGKGVEIKKFMINFDLKLNLTQALF
jgi:hypothetical protein